MKNTVKNKRAEGFTIIEVMIVLAIAGLIMLIVFLAVPQLQKSQRNEHRKTIADRISTEIDNFASNNTGRIPAAQAACTTGNLGSPVCAGGGANDTFFNRYLGCPGAAPTYCSGNINDPRAGVPVGTNIGGATMTLNTQTNAAAAILGPIPGSLAYSIGAICNGEDLTTTNAQPRNFALQIRLEGNAVQCTDNR
jgi:prepilin-type N-terminal cleavage/methylation domain-containing protein